MIQNLFVITDQCHITKFVFCRYVFPNYQSSSSGSIDLGSIEIIGLVTALSHSHGHSEALQRMESFSITSFPLRITLDNFFRNVLFGQTPPLKQLVCYHRPMSHHKIRFQQIVGSRQKDFLQVSHVN